jgi:hypothetical protein
MEENEMEKTNVVYVVTWGRATPGGEEGLFDAYCGCEGVFTNKEKALKKMTSFKDSFIEHLFDDADFDEEELQEFKNAIGVYGSEKEGYYEIDYPSWDDTCEIYIEITEMPIE